MKKLIILLSVTIASCNATLPKMDLTFWAGDSKNSGITRAQDHTSIECSDPKFEEYVCVTYTDVRKLFATILQCKDWGAPVMTSLEKKSFARKNSLVLVKHEN